MSRARTLAGAIGSDGALNVADVAGLAAVASSGSASDLATGTLPIARIADGAVANAKLASDLDASKLTAGTLPIARVADGAVVTAKLADSSIHTGKIADSAVTAAKMHTTAVTDKLGYTPVNKAGDTMTGPLTVTALTSSQVMAPQVSTNGGFINTGVLGSSGYAWEVFGTVNPNSQGSSYVDVIHGYVYIGYGWNGSDLTAYLQWVSIAPPAREAYPSGTGNSGNVIDVVFWNGTSEANTVSAGSLASNQLRIKIPNYNTSGVSSAGFYITRKA